MLEYRCYGNAPAGEDTPRRHGPRPLPEEVTVDEIRIPRAGVPSTSAPDHDEHPHARVAGVAYVGHLGRMDD